MNEHWSFEDWENAIGDSKNWEVFQITKEVIEKEDLKEDYSIRYVGPIVNGCTIEPVPKVPMLYKTFAGRRELVQIPLGLERGLNYDIVEGCNKFNPSTDSLVKYTESYGNISTVQQFNDTGSPYIIDAKGMSKKRYSEIVSMLIGNEPEVVQKQIVEKFGENFDKPGFFFSERGLLEALGVVKEQVKPKVLKFSTGYTLNIVEVHKASEMKYSAKIATKDFALGNQYRSFDLFRTHSDLYVLADDFVIDNDDEVLINTLGIEFNGKELKNPYKAGNDATITVTGDNSIEAEECPLQASGTLTIAGTGTLTLVSNGEMQACIGTATHTGMSYGRWEPGREKPLKKIVIDGVKVVCKSSVPNFSLGSYGESTVPEIECKNGGSIECPEMKGKRVMIASGAEGLSGSTKREHIAKYEIERDILDMDAF